MKSTLAQNIKKSLQTKALIFISSAVFLTSGAFTYLASKHDQSPLNLFFDALILTGLAGLSVYFFFHFVLIEPIRQISSHMKSLNLDHSSEKFHLKKSFFRGSYDELDNIAEQFNSLKDRVMMSNWALKEMNANLEHRVEERTEELIEQTQKLEKSARWTALGEMAGSIAHEINNPLAIIMGKSQLLLRKETSEPTKKSLEVIIKTTQKIAEIIQSLRVLSRDASNDPFEFVQARVIIKDAMGLSMERLKKNQIEFEVSKEFDEYDLSCRRVQVAQVLINLINNAVDAISDKPNAKIKLEMKEKEGSLILSVIDSGPGFAPEIRDKILTPYFTTKGIGKGTGLGLNLSRNIMEAHKGELAIDFEAPSTTINLIFKNYRRSEIPFEQAS